MSMMIGGKSKLEFNQLMDRKQKGVDSIEVYTDIKTFMVPTNSNDGLKLLNELDMTAYAVHAPMRNEENWHISVGNLTSNERARNLNIIKQSIEMAHHVCKVDNPIVIIHAGGHYELELYSKFDLINRRTKEIDMLKKDLQYLNNYIISKYPSVILGIENHCIFTYENGKVYGFNYGKDFDLPEVIRSLKLSNIKAVLDICHAQSVCNYDKLDVTKKNRKIEDFIRAYSDTLCLIHLANVKDFGEIEEKHGTPFHETPNDIDRLKKVIKTLEETGYKGRITLEILEKDHTNALNLKTTINTIKNIGYEKYIY
ncbi:TIM barrel protein [Alkaliphilus sp. B6464]|uniref:TIM barrel protein n=1 Tax=Alkaliphilus sp. B6464 TaxID=2731219 RepID=UPI001BAE1E04|nr:TIM barrel protein [Alkaliphilus sp. B6464]QUH21846.1 TIM barrel protein [Alkaliphilus sp. B6464]